MPHREPASQRQAAPCPGRLRRIVFGLGAALVALALCELGLRAASGLVSPARASAAPPGSAYTLLCVGDSWTEGAAYGRYPDALVQRLTERHPGQRFHQANAGRSGTNSSQALRRLPYQLATETPALLLVLTGNNDHHNLTASTYWRFEERELGPGSILAARLRVAGHGLRSVRLGRALWRTASGGSTANEFFEADRDVEERRGLIAIDVETHRRQLEYNLTRIVELARSERVPVVFQTYFHFHGYQVNEVIRDVAVRLGVPLVDHNLLFHTRIPPAEREGFRIADGHPNARGYGLMADNILEVLESQRLLP